MKKLTLSNRKSSYLIINKYPHIPVHSDFKISINSIELKRSKTIKYLGLWLDENINWLTHIKHLETILAKYTGMFYKIRKFVDTNALKTLYYSFIHSRLQYGIITWGIATKSALKELSVKLNNVIRAITYTRSYCKTSPLYSQLKFLKLINQ